MKKLFIKSASPIPEGAQWITVHPNGEGSKGQPVLVMPEKDGTARVIGGAGGKLNYLKLRGVKSKGEYAAESAKRQEEAKAKRAAQTQVEKETGVYEQRQAQRRDLAEKKRAVERNVIDTVAELAGWSKESLEFPENDPAFEGLSQGQLEKAKVKWHNNLVRRAKSAIKESQQKLLNDANARADAGIGEVPLFSQDPDALSVADLDPDKRPSGTLGFNPHYRERADANTPTPAGDAADPVDTGPSLEENKAAFADGKGGEAIAGALDKIAFPPSPKVSVGEFSGADALKLVMQGKKFAQIEAAVREAKGEINKGIESKAMVLDVSDDADLSQQAREAVFNDMRTASTVAFLNEVGRVAGGDPGETLGGHIGVGAYDSLNAMSLAVGGNAMLDRSVVDVLGVAGAASVLARRFHQDLSPDELQFTTDGITDYHVNQYMKTGTESLKKAQGLMAEAAAIELSPDAQNGTDLAIAQAMNAERRDKVITAQRILGQSLGQMEANAAMVAAMRMGAQDSVTVSMGNKSDDAIATQLAALGLSDGDYSVEKAGSNQILTVTAQGMDKLAQPTSMEDVARVKRNVDIISGKYDEAGWLPQGVANRPDLAMKVQPGTADQIGQPFSPQEDLRGAVLDYIGGRAADGDSAVDILADMGSDDFTNAVGADRADEYNAILSELAPPSQFSGNASGSLDALESRFSKLADDYVAKIGGKISPINRQKVTVDQNAVDALHRALASTPQGVAAYKQVGELSGKEIRALRGFFASSMVPKGGDHKQAWADLTAAMGSSAGAIHAVQDAVKSSLSRTFVESYNQINPDKPIKLGKTLVNNSADFMKFADPGAADAHAKSLEGIDPDHAAYLHTTAASGDLSPGTRFTAGHAIDRQIAGMMGVVGQNFKPDQPTKLWAVSMDGKYINQQRAVKYFESNKRMALAFGPGSGKTNIMLGSFADLKSKGKVKRGIFLVPSIVQGQFNGEALRLMAPGQFKWNINPGASREERIAAYKDGDTDFCVMTHQSFRDDMIYLAAKQSGKPETEVSESLQSMTPAERSDFFSGVMSKEGINFDASFVDEAHETLNREGKENSGLANVLDAVTSKTPYYMYASGDPVKNDASEIHSLMEKMDPSRYGDRSSFMRKYGVDTMASKDSLKREMARYVFPASITPDVDVSRHLDTIPLSAGQQKAISQLDGTVNALRSAKAKGTVDIAAARQLSPAMFDGVPESEHAAVAERVQNSLGIIKDSAVRRIIDTASDSGKFDHAMELVNKYQGKQGVIFAKNRAAVAEYEKRMKAAGKRVVTITGSDSGAEKERKKQMFNPDKGEAQADIMIASDAAAVGMNLQSGQFLIQHDIPDTAKNHAQRDARIFRLGQKNAIDLHQLQADHASDKRAYKRLQTKYQLRELMASPMDGLDDTGIAGAIEARRAMAQGVTL